MNLRFAKVLVTGSTGFLGKYVMDLLRERCEIAPEVFRRDGRELTRQFSGLYEACRDKDCVIHLAALCGGIGLNQERPADLGADNLLMGLHVLRSCKAAIRKPKLVMIGSVCAYPKYCPVPFREEDLWQGYPEETNAAYGIAKRTLGILAEAYHRQYGLNVTTLIPTNLYGPGDHFDDERSHVIPALIKSMVEARDNNQPAVVLWGTGEATRDFLHVRDAASAIVRAIEVYDEPAPLNLGTGIEVSIAALANMVRDAVGFGGDLIWDANKPDGQPRRCLNINRAKEAIGFAPTIGLLEGISETVNWYEAQRVEATV